MPWDGTDNGEAGGNIVDIDRDFGGDNEPVQDIQGQFFCLNTDDSKYQAQIPDLCLM